MSALSGSDKGGAAHLTAADDSDHVTCTVTGAFSENSVTLRVRVNRLLWGVTRTDDPATVLGNQVAVVASDDLIEGVTTAVVVRTGVVDARLGLRLDDGTSQIQRSDDVATSGSDGRWIFDLARFRDSVRASDEPRLRFLAIVEGRPVPIVEVRASLDLGPVGVRTVTEGDFCAVKLEFDEYRPLRNRVARLWSLDRPVGQSVTEPIPDHQTRSAEISGYARFPVGHTSPRSPSTTVGQLVASRLGTRNTARVQVGTADEWNTRLQALANDDDPFAVLEIANATGAIRRNLDAFELRQITPAALDAAFIAIDEQNVRGNVLTPISSGLRPSLRRPDLLDSVHSQ